MNSNKLVYFFENKQGLWLKNKTRTETTNNPNEAAYLKDKFEAELFCYGLNGQEKNTGEWTLTEHLFI